MKLTKKAHQAWSQVVQLNDSCVDMTLGNGWDALQLCNLVGKEGKVYGFDIQEDALNLFPLRRHHHYNAEGYKIIGNFIYSKIRDN